MDEAGLRPGLRAFNGVLKACEKSVDATEAEGLLRMMAARCANPTPTPTPSPNPNPSPKPEPSSDSLTPTLTRGVAPDAISYTSAMGALGRAGAWERALALWREMAANGLEADSKALLSAMRALLGASQWRAALTVFEDAPPQARASSNARAFSSARASSAPCDRGWQRPGR